MKTNMLNLRHHGRIGPGGWHCACCTPAPTHRNLEARLHKKRMYRILDKMERENLRQSFQENA